MIYKLETTRVTIEPGTISQLYRSLHSFVRRRRGESKTVEREGCSERGASRAPRAEQSAVREVRTPQFDAAVRCRVVFRSIGRGESGRGESGLDGGGADDARLEDDAAPSGRGVGLDSDRERRVGFAGVVERGRVFEQREPQSAGTGLRSPEFSLRKEAYHDL